MVIEYQLSKKDYIKFSKFYIIDMLKRRQWFLILLAFILISSLSDAPFVWDKFLLKLVIDLLIIAGVLLTLLLISFIRINKIVSKENSFLEKKTLTVLDDGIQIESESKTTIWKWESIASVHSNSRFVYLILADKKTLPFPIKAFQHDSDVINFIGEVQSKIFKTIGSFNGPIYHPPINKKPSYLLCLICLIPFFGGIAGAVFIILGFFKYKDKWFVISGTLGVALSVIIWINYFYTNNFGFQTVLKENSQKQINGLMKAIEFYKLKNGVYPDSLEQINDDNSEIWIYDPLQANDEVTKKDNYNYQKIGDHYYLFSSGVDGIPNTKDDFYPQVAKSNSAKFGLIKK